MMATDVETETKSDTSVAKRVACPSATDPSLTTSFEGPCEESISFFKEHGFVVFAGLLDADRLSVTVEEVWDSIEQLSPDVERDDPSTWTDDFWPVDDMNRGFIDVSSRFRLSESWRNRQLPTVVEAFQSILGTNEVWARSSRYGVMRPPAAAPPGESWLTARSWLHWDQNPWREPDFKSVQGLLTLTDHTLTSGGFECIPGFTDRFKEWGLTNTRDPSNESMDGSIVFVPKADPALKEVCQVTMAAGSLLIWDSRTPHANYPVSEDVRDGFRMVQYTTFNPADPDVEEQTAYKERVEAQLASSHSFELGEFPGLLSELGRKIVGLDVWKA